MLLLVAVARAQQRTSGGIPANSPSSTSSVVRVGSTAGTEASPDAQNLFSRIFGADATKNVIAALQLAAALSNLGVVVWIFSQNTRLRKLERVEDLQERRLKLRLETSNFWIQKLILEPNNKWLHEFFNECARHIETTGPEFPSDEGEARKAVQDSINKFRGDLRTLRARIEEPLLLVSTGFSALAPVLVELQDLVTGSIHLAYLGVPLDQNVEGERPAERYRRIRRAFFEVIYKVQNTITTV